MTPQVPSLWREELLHPLTVHLPVVLLPAAALLALIALFRKNPGARAELDRVGWWCLAIGTFAAWIAVYTGSVAEDVVNRVICDPTVTHRHEDLAKISATIFSAALAFTFIPRFTQRFAAWSRWACVATLVIGCIYLVRASHLGVSLVYQQGAAVYRPSEYCEEFE